MKKILISLLLIICLTTNVLAIEVDATGGYKMKATAYCLTGKTATGTYTKSGVCASKREWFGKRVAVYEADSEGNAVSLIGYFSVEDTGGAPIQKGHVIDIWLPTYEECKQFGWKNVIVFLLEE